MSYEPWWQLVSLVDATNPLWCNHLKTKFNCLKGGGGEERKKGRKKEAFDLEMFLRGLEFQEHM